MARRGRFVWITGAVALLALLLVVSVIEGLRTTGQRESASVSPTVTDPKTALSGGTEAQDAAVTGAGVPTQQRYAGTAEALSGAERLTVRNAQLAMRVNDVQDAVDTLRRLAGEASATVQSLTLSDDGGVVTLGTESSDDRGTPRSAYVILRVPVELLDRLTDELAGIGTIVSQSESADDVTEQHVDLAARLKNMRSEEERLRSFFAAAKNVTEMLAVETELARVRGEIESLQAQVDYLERQAAQATLTVELHEPGAVVRPDGVDWGFGDAITLGVQASAAALRTLLTAAVAASPFALIGLVVWVFVRVGRRRRRPGTATPRPTTTHEADDPGEGEHGQS